MKKRMKRFKNRRTTSTAAILCMAALLFAVLLAGCSVQKETEASGDQQQETWSEEMENSTALSEEPDDTDTIGNADNPEDTGDIGNPENPEDTSTALTLPILDQINSKVQIGTSGSSLIAVQAAVKLLEWGEHTGLDPEEIREAASAWLSEQTDSDREEALLKLVGLLLHSAQSVCDLRKLTGKLFKKAAGRMFGRSVRIGSLRVSLRSRRFVRVS